MIKTKAITVCGSLRSPSSNGELLAAYEQLAPASLEVSRLDTLDTLPLYNPDLDAEPLPESVVETRRQVAAADFVVFSTPEYIHALPAALKNLLEWLVSDPSFYGKRVVILHANQASTFALESLREVLKTMSAEIIEDACVTLTLGSNKVTAEEILGNPDWRKPLEGSLAAALGKLA